MSKTFTGRVVYTRKLHKFTEADAARVFAAATDDLGPYYQLTAMTNLNAKVAQKIFQGWDLPGAAKIAEVYALITEAIMNFLRGAPELAQALADLLQQIFGALVKGDEITIGEPPVIEEVPEDGDEV